MTIIKQDSKTNGQELELKFQALTELDWNL